MKERCAKSELVTLLDGDIVEVEGVKIGGAMAWYDGTYNAPQAYGYTDPVAIWKRTMNDANWIRGYKDFYDLLIQERPKVEAILDADIILTHVCPLAHRIAFQEEYQYEQSSMFYAFNGEDYLMQTKAKYWIYGHSHGEHEFEIYGTECKMNALGYPGEKRQLTVKTIEV